MTIPHDKALSAAINEIRLWQVNMTAGEFVVFRRSEDGTITDEARHSSLEENHSDFTALSMNAAISAYLSSIGGIVCHREPVGFGVQRMGEFVGFIPGGDINAEYRLPEDDLPRIPLHTPIEARSGNDGWISVEDKLPGEQGHDNEEVLCFLNGHCDLHDMECRRGGGWGIRLGFYDAERFAFRCGGRPTAEVTHWRRLPARPSIQENDGGTK